jgi:hypothetical protein
MFRPYTLSKAALTHLATGFPFERRRNRPPVPRVRQPVEFELQGQESKAARTRLLERRILVTTGPYPSACLRMTPGSSTRRPRWTSP